MCVTTKWFVGSSRRNLRGVATHWGWTETLIGRSGGVMSGAASPGCYTALLCWALGCWRQPLACHAQETGTATHMQEKLAQAWGQSIWRQAQTAQCPVGTWAVLLPSASCSHPLGSCLTLRAKGSSSTSQRHSTSPCSAGLVWHSPAPLRLHWAASSWRACQWLLTTSGCKSSNAR